MIIYIIDMKSMIKQYFNFLFATKMKNFQIITIFYAQNCLSNNLKSPHSPPTLIRDIFEKSPEKHPTFSDHSPLSI